MMGPIPVSVVSLPLVAFRDLQPVKQRIELRSSVKLTLVDIRYSVRVAVAANRFMTWDAVGPAPPVLAKINWLKLTFSPSNILCSYLRFFCDT